MPFDQAASRRQFLKFQSASPLLAGSSALAGEGPPTIKHLVPGMVRRVT